MRKKITAIFASILISLSFVSLFPVSAENAIANFPYATGGLLSPIYETSSSATNNELNTTSDLPSRIDLSTDLAFPCIGNQGSIGSCTAWATTYYQFTYEVNKLKGTAAKEMVNNEYVNIEENVYSPTWTYNLINGGGNNGTFDGDAYRVLTYQGAMTLADMPYDASNYDFDEWSSNISKLTEALEYRINKGNVSSLNSAKEKLADGHTLVVWTNSFGWAEANNSDGQRFIVRCGNVTDSNGNLGGHFMTIVGYDDEIEITVNGITLTGAFKVANSWGDNWGNDGYIWVSYDAINSTSEFTGWETGFNGSRTSVFGGYNFRYVTAYHCDVTFAGYVEYTSTQKYDIAIYAADSSSVSKSNSYKKWDCAIGNSKTVSSYTTPPKILVFDFFAPGTTVNVGDYMTSNWTILLNDTSTSGTETISMRTRVIDNFGNMIAPNTYNYTNLSNGELSITMPVNLAKGRVTAYDNSAITSEDSQMILNFITRKIDLSNVQRYLADYNNDGNISLTDVTAMNSAIAAQNGETYVITDYIDEWGCSLADVIEEEYNMPIEQYVAENYAELSAMNAVPSELELY